MEVVSIIPCVFSATKRSNCLNLALILLMFSTSESWAQDPYVSMHAARPLQGNINTKLTAKCCFFKGNRSDLESQVALIRQDNHNKSIYGCSNLNSRDHFSCSSLNGDNCWTITIMLQLEYDGAELMCSLYVNSGNGNTEAENSTNLVVIEDTESTPTSVTSTMNNSDDPATQTSVIGIILPSVLVSTVLLICGLIVLVIVFIIIYKVCTRHPKRQQQNQRRELDESMTTQTSELDDSTEASQPQTTHFWEDSICDAEVEVDGDAGGHAQNVEDNSTSMFFKRQGSALVKRRPHAGTLRNAMPL